MNDEVFQDFPDLSQAKKTTRNGITLQDTALKVLPPLLAESVNVIIPTASPAENIHLRST